MIRIDLSLFMERVNKMKFKWFLLMLVSVFLGVIPVTSAESVTKGYEGTYAIQSESNLSLRGYQISDSQFSLFFNLPTNEDEANAAYSSILVDWINRLSNQESQALLTTDMTDTPKSEEKLPRAYLRLSIAFQYPTLELVIENPHMTKEDDTLYITYENSHYKFTQTAQGMTDLAGNLLEEVKIDE